MCVIQQKIWYLIWLYFLFLFPVSLYSTPCTMSILNLVVSDSLLLQIEWARANDDKVKVIAENGRKYAQENLMPKDVYCYHAALLKVSQLRLNLMPQKLLLCKNLFIGTVCTPCGSIKFYIHNFSINLRPCKRHRLYCVLFHNSHYIEFGRR